MPDLTERLENWGCAMRVYRGRARAMSLEGQYRSPQRNHWDEPVTAISNHVDRDDAIKVEHAWATLDLPDKAVLRYHYCSRLHHHVIRRIMRRSIKSDFGNFEVELQSAQVAIGVALLRDLGQNRNILRRMAQRMLDMVA